MRTNAFHESFFPATVREWNRLGTELKNATSLEQFNELLPQKETPKSYYYTGTRRGQILHTRMRLKCSDLNSHLYEKKLVPSPECPCGEPSETEEHLLLECPLYDVQRRTLIESLRFCDIITAQFLLHGDELLSDEENQTVFQNTQRFLLTINRFE